MSEPLPRTSDASTGLVVELFGGISGWAEALRLHWSRVHRSEIGFEWDRDACRTRIAAGHRTIRGDVAMYPLNHFGQVVGLIASPPCQTFSAAGNGDGRDDLDRLIWHAHRGLLLETPDARTGLVLEPLRWIHALHPRWVALEQVPAVAPVWHAYEHHLRSLGYATWSGVCNAANYGVPQTRKRAILLASLDRQPTRPVATHERNPDGMFGLAPWVSMADALGWPNEWGTGQETNRGRGMSERYGPRPIRPASSPSEVISSKTRSWAVRTDVWQLRAGVQANATVRTAPAPAPAPALAFGHDVASWVWERPATTLVGSFCPDVVAAPGYRSAGDESRQDAEGSIRITIEDALVLQDFRPDYPVAGSRTSQFQQVGNAIPVGLARAALAEVLG